MKKFFILVITVFCLSGISKAQDYNTAIGLRAGLFNGFTIKHFVSSDAAIEGLLSTRWGGFSLTGLYEIHANAFNTTGLNWYYGAGAHIGFWNGDKANWGNDDENYTVIGLDGIIGMEYNIKEIPLNVSLDWKPALNLFGHTGLWGDNIALSVRYRF